MNNLIQCPRWIYQISVISAVLVLLGLLGLILPWNQFSAGSGKVISFDPNERFQEIHAPISGFIQNWHVSEGSFVKKGQLLVSLTDIDSE